MHGNKATVCCFGVKERLSSYLLKSKQLHVSWQASIEEAHRLCRHGVASDYHLKTSGQLRLFYITTRQLSVSRKSSQSFASMVASDSHLKISSHLNPFQVLSYEILKVSSIIIVFNCYQLFDISLYLYLPVEGVVSWNSQTGKPCSSAL